MWQYSEEFHVYCKNFNIIKIRLYWDILEIKSELLSIFWFRQENRKRQSITTNTRPESIS